MGDDFTKQCFRTTTQTFRSSCKVIVDSRHFEITGVRMTNGPPCPGSNDICGPV